MLKGYPVPLFWPRGRQCRCLLASVLVVDELQWNLDLALVVVQWVDGFEVVEVQLVDLHLVGLGMECLRQCFVGWDQGCKEGS